MNAAQEKGIREFHDLDGDILRLIRACNWDLHNGPLSQDEARDLDLGKWYGFSDGIKRLAAALEDSIGDVWVDVNGIVQSDEPRWFGADECDGNEDDPGEHPENWMLVDASIVKRILVGRALAEYL